MRVGNGKYMRTKLWVGVGAFVVAQSGQAVIAHAASPSSAVADQIAGRSGEGGENERARRARSFAIPVAPRPRGNTPASAARASMRVAKTNVAKVRVRASADRASLSVRSQPPWQHADLQRGVASRLR